MLRANFQQCALTTVEILSMKLISLITVESENAWKLGLEYVCGPKEWWNPEPDIRLIDKTSLCLPQNANIWALSTYIILKQISSRNPTGFNATS